MCIIQNLITGILELLPAVTTWAREILSANEKLDATSYPHRTIEERNARSLKLMDISNVPKFNWTVDENNGDITGRQNELLYYTKFVTLTKIHFCFIVISETKPKSVHLWHADTSPFFPKRRDFRIANLDDPCLTGPIVSIGGYNNLCSNLLVVWTAEVIM